MNKKQQISKKGRKQAAVGMAVCFVAVIALTGAYTLSHYKNKTKKEMELAKAEEQTKQDTHRKDTQETNHVVSKAEEPNDKEDTEHNNNQPSENSEDQHSSLSTSGSTNQVNFSENDELLWPVNGNVLMSYDMDKTVYFSTLDQYKYNPALIISGTLNDNVIAAAPGIIKSIDVLPQTGTTVTMDMGNGYECLYGQLKEVPGKVGDYLTAGEVVGYLSEPTKYYSVEGCNLYFELRKDGQPVNPMDFLAEE